MSIARSCDLRAFTPSATTLQGVDVETGVGLVENGELRIEHRHLEDLVRFFSPPEKPSLTARSRSAFGISMTDDFSLQHRQELDGVELFLAARLADGIERGAQEVGCSRRDLHRILERQEDALAGALLGLHLEQVFPPNLTSPSVIS
jgi:hypothetical protein